MHLDLQIAVDRILFGPNSTINRFGEAGPSGIAFVLRRGHEQWLITAGANENAWARLMIERATSRRLRAKPTHDHVLVRLEQLTPFGVAAGDGGSRFHLNDPVQYLLNRQRLAHRPTMPLIGLADPEVKDRHRSRLN